MSCQWQRSSRYGAALYACEEIQKKTNWAERHFQKRRKRKGWDETELHFLMFQPESQSEHCIVKKDGALNVMTDASSLTSENQIKHRIYPHGSLMAYTVTWIRFRLSFLKNGWVKICTLLITRWLKVGKDQPPTQASLFETCQQMLILGHLLGGCNPWQVCQLGHTKPMLY